MKIANPAFCRFLLLLTAPLVLISAAGATENGGSVWPLGAESYATAAGVPGPGETMFYEYTAFLTANQLDDAQGHRIPMDFKVRGFAVAAQFTHNWGVKFLGGQLGSHIAMPYIYEQLNVEGIKNSNESFSNFNVVPLELFNHKGIAFWDYELQYQTVASGYQKGAALNIGEHNESVAPGFALTLLPHKGAQNINSVVDYIINNADHVTHYHSGNELLWQFDAQQEIPGHKASIGVQGYFYKQNTDDSQYGASVVSTNADGSHSLGYKGRVLDLGPQFTLPWGKHGALVFKWNHDMLVQNKIRGNSFWFQFGIPFSYMHHSDASPH
jgi:hypothetical protein